ncbi:MAG: GTP-binding protein [Candidatus Lokiarchaeota archaeon]|nr:GTP-binding protein [Candidatus Lokiarchaeota archaeon]
MLRSELNSMIKITLIGSPAVGKTTMLRLLARETIDKLYLPTHGLDLKTVKFDDYILRVWDLAGQESYFKTYSKDYLLGTDIIFIVTDSSPRNVLNSRELINYACHFVGKECPIIAIANKQDLVKTDGRMEAKRVEDILHVKTYGLTAINPSERIRLMNIIKKELDQIVIRRGLKE